jgi:hypothetical protein
VKDLRDGVDPKATKNIPKNYAKAIITYIIKSQDQPVMKRFFKNAEEEVKFIEYLKQKKFKIQNIKQFSFMMTNTVDDAEQ